MGQLFDSEIGSRLYGPAFQWYRVVDRCFALFRRSR